MDATPSAIHRRESITGQQGRGVFLMMREFRRRMDFFVHAHQRRELTVHLRGQRGILRQRRHGNQERGPGKDVLHDMTPGSSGNEAS